MKCHSLAISSHILMSYVCKTKKTNKFALKIAFELPLKFLSSQEAEKGFVTFDLFEMSYEQLKRVFWPGYPNTSKRRSDFF
jgi:hypothetical protein